MIQKVLFQNKIWILMCVVFLFIVFRNIGLYPVVFADEYLYSKFTRLTPLSEAGVPNYLYFAIYRLTNICGNEFLSCARIINAIFFVSAMPFIYWTARKVASENLSAFIAFIAIAGSMNSYTAYFMPESMYFFTFWLFIWFMIRIESSSSWLLWSIAGILFAFSALVKPHSIFFLPSIFLYIFYISFVRHDNWFITWMQNTILFVISASITKFFIGYILAGIDGVTFFGPIYSSIATSTGSVYQKYIDLLLLSMSSIKGHILAICIVYGLPLVIGFFLLLKHILLRGENKIDQKITFITMAIIINMIFVVALFTASVSGAGPYESIGRLHMRYYNFALPLLLIVTVTEFKAINTEVLKKWRIYIALLIVSVIIFAMYTKLAPYTPSFVDSPEIRGVTVKDSIFYSVSLLSVVSICLWIYSSKLGVKFFFYVFIPIFIIFSNYFINSELRNRLIPDVYDEAGIFTKRFLGDSDISKVLIISSNDAGNMRSLFYIDNKDASFKTIPEGASYDFSTLPVDKKWILFIGDHGMIDNSYYKLAMNGFTLVRASKDVVVNFNTRNWQGVISEIHGLSTPEPWGAWSDKKDVIFDFAVPLPDNFRISLIASAFGPNTGKICSVTIGGDSKKFVLGPSAEEHILEFKNPKRLSVVNITVPEPISPHELGLNDDIRKLGIGFFQLKVNKI